LITAQDLLKGHEAYIDREGRDGIYRVATYLVDRFWGHPKHVADGMGVLLLAWNARFTNAYGVFDFDSLEDCIRRNQENLNKLRKRSILSWVENDHEITYRLFTDFMYSLQAKKRPALTPVGAAKALHLIAPGFFALWDDKIAKGLGYYWHLSENAPRKYVSFQSFTAKLAKNISDAITEGTGDFKKAEESLCGRFQIFGEANVRTLVKLIDEYNYAKFTLKAPGL